MISYTLLFKGVLLKGFFIIGLNSSTIYASEIGQMPHSRSLGVTTLSDSTQTSPTTQRATNLSIEAFLEHLKQHPQLHLKRLESDIKRAELDEARLDRLPLFYADANAQRNLIIPTTPVPAIAFDPNASPGEILPLKFATKWSAKGGLQVDWQLFDPLRANRERKIAVDIERSNLDEKEAWQNLKRDAILAYTSIVLATKQYEAARRDSTLLSEILQVSKARYEAGREPASAYFRAEQEFERTQIKLLESWSVLLEADLEISNYLDASTIRTVSYSTAEIQSYLEQEYKLENYAIGQAELDLQSAALEMGEVRRQRLPSLNLTGYLGEQYYGNDFNINQGDRWHGNSFINLGFRLPLTPFLTSAPSLRRASLRISSQREDLEQLIKEDHIDKAQRNLRIATTKSRVEGLKRIEELAKLAAANAAASYTDGRVLWS